MTPLGQALDATVVFLERFVAFRSQCAARTIALWIGAAHVVRKLDVMPQLLLVSPEMRSGKTRTLEVVELMLGGDSKVIRAVDMSPAAMYRTVHKDEEVVLIFDEIDALLSGPQSRTPKAESVRAILNGGHRRGTTVLRIDGPKFEVKKFNIFSPKVLAGILPPEGFAPTFMDRSIAISLFSRTADQPIEKFRIRNTAPEGLAISDQLELALQDFAFPDGFVLELDALDDRALDNWEPLVAVADKAGGKWPTWSREAAVELSRDRDVVPDSLGRQLLVDCHRALGDRSKISTDELLRYLKSLPESPWLAIDLTAKRLSDLLRPYGIQSRQIRFGDSKKQGYRTESFFEAWRSYLSNKPTALEIILDAFPGSEIVEDSSSGDG